jgi:hypothetical protein
MSIIVIRQLSEQMMQPSQSFHAKTPASKLAGNIMSGKYDSSAIFVAPRADVAVHHSLVLSGFYHP